MELIKNQNRRLPVSPAIAARYGSKLSAAVADGSSNPIRHLRRPPAVEKAGGVGDGAGNFVAIIDDLAFRRYVVAGEVAKIARAGGARHKIPADVLRRAVDLVIDYFSDLGAAELSAAFDLALAGKIEGVNLAMYGGQFNAVYLSEILRAYRKHRAEIRLDLARNAAAIEAKAAEEKRAVMLKQKALPALADALGDFFEAARRGEEPPAGRVLMAYQYDMIEGLIAATVEEKREAMDAARGEILRALSEEKGRNLDGLARLTVGRLMENLSADDGRIVAEAKVRILRRWINKAAAGFLTLNDFKKRIINY